ncbi:MAG: hypothetical protein PHC41_09285 [Lachnospiraceae bacterium]|nr:hypothetical protein [Lachnospiraceae bacterium]MDD3616403.1 hypothetical protein [Lachnospiraceae bacterium]
MKKKIFIPMLLLSLSLAGCQSTAISQNDYDTLKQEYASLQTQYDSLKSELSELTKQTEEANQKYEELQKSYDELKESQAEDSKQPDSSPEDDSESLSPNESTDTSSSNVNWKGFSDGSVSFEYNPDKFSVQVLDDESSTVKLLGMDMPEPSDGCYTLLHIKSYYDETGDDSSEYKKSVAEDLANDLSTPEGTSVVSEGFTSEGSVVTYVRTLSDGLKCMASVLHGGTTTTYAICRICSYSKDYNADFSHSFDSLSYVG